MKNINVSGITAVGAVIALVCLALAAILLIAPDRDDRLALFLGLVGLALPVFLGNLKADQAASNTNGKLDARIEAAVHRAQSARRRGDEPLTSAQIDAGATTTSPTDPA